MIYIKVSRNLRSNFLNLGSKLFGFLAVFSTIGTGVVPVAGVSMKV